jgi:hypothetical protein
MRQCTWKCVCHSYVLFYDAVHVEMSATSTCFSMRLCTWKCTSFPRAFLWSSARGNVRHSHVLFYDAVHVEMYAIPTSFSTRQCTWKCTSFPRAFLWRGACRNVRHFYVFDTNAILLCALPRYGTYFSKYFFSRSYVAVHVEVRHSHCKNHNPPHSQLWIRTGSYGTGFTYATSHCFSLLGHWTRGSLLAETWGRDSAPPSCNRVSLGHVLGREYTQPSRLTSSSQ